MRLRLTTWIAWGVALFGILVISAAVIPGLLNSTASRERLQTTLDLQRLTVSARIYASKNEGILPEANRWCDQLVSILGTNKEPSLDPWYLGKFLSRKRCGYAINSMVAGRKLEILSTNDIIFLPVINKGRNLSVSIHDIEALAWDNKGFLKIVELSNSTREFERPDKASK